MFERRTPAAGHGFPARKEAAEVSSQFYRRDYWRSENIKVKK
jgi:hypothetical protein